MIQHVNIFSKHLAQLKQSGSYRYFLNVNKRAQHFQRFSNPLIFQQYQEESVPADNRYFQA